MPTRKVEFVGGEIYHIIIRGVEGRQIFMDEEDFWRAIFGLYEFNTSVSVTIREQREKRKKFKESLKQLSRDRDSVNSEEISRLEAQSDQRKILVEILAFVFMPNHIHLLLRQVIPNGIVLFMQKFNVGYAMYFNSRYERKGVLFQGRFGATYVDNDDYLKTVFTYIHTNPISIIEPKWKEKGILDVKKAIGFLNNYRWSSYLDYIGIKNFLSVTARDFGLMVFVGSKENFEPNGKRVMADFIEKWIEFKHSIV